MNDITTSMTRKGQVTVPIEVRRLLGLKPRDRVSFILGDDGVRIERAASGLDAIAGSVKPRKRPEDFKEPRRGRSKRALEDVRRGPRDLGFTEVGAARFEPTTF